MNTPLPLDYGLEIIRPNSEEQEQILHLKREFYANEVHINRGRAALGFLVVAEIFGFMHAVSSDVRFTEFDLIFAVLVIALFSVLLILSFGYAFQMLTASLVLYLLFMTVILIDTPPALLNGLLIKGLIIYFLSQGIRHARFNQHIADFLSKFGEVPNLTDFLKIRSDEKVGWSVYSR